MFLISEVEEPLKLQDMMNEFSNKTNCVLIIDGISLACALQNQ